MFSASGIGMTLIEPHSSPLRSEHYGLQYSNRLDELSNQVWHSQALVWVLTDISITHMTRESVIDSSCSYLLLPWQFQRWLCAAIAPMDKLICLIVKEEWFMLPLYGIQKSDQVWVSVVIPGGCCEVLLMASRFKQVPLPHRLRCWCSVAPWLWLMSRRRSWSCAILASQLTLGCVTCISWFAHECW